MKIKHILIVDDSKPNNVLCRKILESTGLVDFVFSVYDGEEALDYIFNRENFEKVNSFPEIILLDINMPKMDGFQFLKELEEHLEFIKFTPYIVMLTSSDWNVDRLQANSNKLVQGFIEKPLNKSKIEKVFNEYNTYLTYKNSSSNSNSYELS